MDVQILELLRDGGAYTALIVVLWAILTKRIIPGWAYKEALEREAKWEKLALTGTALAREATSIASHKER